MSKIDFPYGDGIQTLDMDDSRIMALVQANALNLPKMGQEQVVRSALANPVNSKPLAEILKPGDKVCVIVPDITRLWVSPFAYVPVLLDEMNTCGIKDSDITILCATGTHRKMTDEEHKKLLGEAFGRVKVVDHVCEDMDSHVFMGSTSHGTPVYLDRRAVEADKLIITCGVVYHLLAGFGGGAKALLPGIAANESIQRNHCLALNEGFGSGLNLNARAGNITASNPIHEDMVEAAAMLPPDFALNVVVDESFKIIKAFAGAWRESHLEACKLVEDMDGVKIPEKSDFVIAGAGGSPKDMNVYQGVKLLNNAMAAAKPGAVMILAGQFANGFGNEDTRRLVCDFNDMREREKDLRANFSIGSYAGFLAADAAEMYNLILVTDMLASDFAATKARVVKTLDEALALAEKDLPANARAIIMPHGATTFPLPQK